MWPNQKETANLVTFTEEIFNGKLHFLWKSIPQVLPIGALANNVRENSENLQEEIFYVYIKIIETGYLPLQYGSLTVLLKFQIGCFKEVYNKKQLLNKN